MAEPFTLTLLPDAKPLTLKPGWHKRALAAERRHKVTTAPQRGNPDADAKAVTYAVWLAARDGIAIPGDGAVSRVDWQPCASGVRPRAVEWMPARQPYRPAACGMAQPAVEPLLRIELPHWDYEAPAVVETTLLEWAAPIVIEVPCGEPDAAIVEPCQPPAVCEPDPADAVPLAALCASDDDAPAAPGPVTVLCLSHKAREALLRRTDGRALPTYAAQARGGAFRLSLADARACAGLKSVRFVGLPRKPYTRAIAPASTPPGGIRAPHPPEAIPSRAWPVAWGYSITGHARTSPVLHAAPSL